MRQGPSACIFIPCERTSCRADRLANCGSEKFISSSGTFRAFYGTWRFLNTNAPCVHILSPINPVCIVPSTSRSTELFLSFRFSYQNTAFLFPYMLHGLPISHTRIPHFCIWWGLQFLKLVSAVFFIVLYFVLGSCSVIVTHSGPPCRSVLALMGETRFLKPTSQQAKFSLRSLRSRCQCSDIKQCTVIHQNNAGFIVNTFKHLHVYYMCQPNVRLSSGMWIQNVHDE